MSNRRGLREGSPLPGCDKSHYVDGFFIFSFQLISMRESQKNKR